jgi:hypothetical protein
LPQEQLAAERQRAVELTEDLQLATTVVLVLALVAAAVGSVETRHPVRRVPAVLPAEVVLPGCQVPGPHLPRLEQVVQAPRAELAAYQRQEVATEMVVMEERVQVVVVVATTAAAVVAVVPLAPQELMEAMQAIAAAAAAAPTI